MKIAIDGGYAVFVSFRYKSGTTRANVEIHNADGPLVGVIDLAQTHPNDRFCKKTGRKIALARALKKTWLNKEQRAKVWNGLMEKGMRV